MGWFRYLTIVPHALKSEVEENLLENFKYKAIGENDSYVLFVYEGRRFPLYDIAETLTVGVDGRRISYWMEGNIALAKEFNVRVELSIGISFKLAHRNTLPDSANNILNILKENYYGDGVPDESADRLNIRFDLPPVEADRVTKLIRELAAVFDELNLPYRIAFFDKFAGTILGSLEESGDDYIGPGAFVFAQGDQFGEGDENFELILNEEETLLNGNSIDDADWVMKAE